MNNLIKAIGIDIILLQSFWISTLCFNENLYLHLFSYKINMRKLFYILGTGLSFFVVERIKNY